MRRFRLFEVLDQPWCPRPVRDGATDCLEAMIRTADSYRPVRDRFFAAIQSCKASAVLDLCSGGGGPWLSPPWREELRRNRGPRVTLTDKFPHRSLAAQLEKDSEKDPERNGWIGAAMSSVDATDVPRRLHGFRTIFSSLHHFADPAAVAILADAVRAGEGFASAEVTSRRGKAAAVILTLPFAVLALTPLIRPFRWSRIVFTYLLPLIPLVILWDGLVSCLRTRTPEELLALTAKFSSYTWSAGMAGDGWMPPVYLIGFPCGETRDGHSE